jgi:hypothetical protein
MIHLYNLGFNGRYIAYPDCEFQEGITRTFDEEAGRHRKFALGGHELMFNPFNSWLGQGIFTPLFKTFVASDIPSYYKIFLTAYLFSYTSGGAYILVFTIAAAARLLDKQDEVQYIHAFNSAGVLIMSIVVSLTTGAGVKEDFGCCPSRSQSHMYSLSLLHHHNITGLLRGWIFDLFDLHGSDASCQQKSAVPRVPKSRHPLPRVQNGPILNVVPVALLLGHGKLLLFGLYGSLAE